jgi:hypothetical protein
VSAWCCSRACALAVEGKRAALESFLADLEARIGRARDVLADLDGLRS